MKKERWGDTKLDAPGVRRHGLRRNVGGDHQVFDLSERREGPSFIASLDEQRRREERVRRALQKAAAAEAKRNAWEKEL